MSGYCQGCNEHYSTAGKGDHCPLCGVRLRVSPSDPPTASTAELDRDAAAGPREHREAPDLSGSVLGKYQIEALIGRGGMSRVYRARHLTLERTCALKVLTPRTREEEISWVPRFLREARSAAGLVHPNVVTVHDIDQQEDLHFIEMEYVEGSTLSALVRDQGPLDPLRAGRYLRQIAEALAHAHQRGLVHRDVKPSNVLVLDAGTVKLTDFGLARPLIATTGRNSKDTGSQHTGSQHTGANDTGADHPSPHTIAGTPYFMAPELFEGAAPTPASDVYAAGVTLYFLLTGRLPFEAESLSDLIAQHRHLGPPDPRELVSDIPRPIAELMTRCLQKSPELRFADGRELGMALHEVIGRLRSLEELVEAALADDDLSWSASDGRVEVSVPLPGDRSQTVRIEEWVSELDGETLVRISSPCAPLDVGYCQRALELNAESHHGAVAIQRFEGRPHFVARSSYPRATCDPEEVRSSIFSVARLADQVEHALTGDDRH